MEQLLDFKLRLREEVSKILKQKLSTLESAFAESRQALFAENKSTAGDKHETGRAMIQLEMEKLGHQIKAAEDQLKHLQMLKSGACDTVEAGALVQLSGRFYYISLSLGQVELDEKPVFLLSAAAPLAQTILGKKKGDHINFRGSEMQLELVV